MGLRWRRSVVLFAENKGQRERRVTKDDAGRNIAMHASPTAMHSAILISTVPVPSTSFCASPLQLH